MPKQYLPKHSGCRGQGSSKFNVALKILLSFGARYSESLPAVPVQKPSSKQHSKPLAITHKSRPKPPNRRPYRDPTASPETQKHILCLSLSLSLSLTPCFGLLGGLGCEQSRNPLPLKSPSNKSYIIPRWPQQNSSHGARSHVAGLSPRPFHCLGPPGPHPRVVRILGLLGSSNIVM